MLTGRFYSLLGQIRVRETDTEITIEGLNTTKLTRDIQGLWRTSKINSYMFTRVGSGYVRFPKFFAPDIIYAIEQLLQYPNRTTNVRILKKMRDEILANTWLADTQREVSPRIDYRRIAANMNLKPLDYQQGFLETYDRIVQQYHLNGYLLAAAAGSGKTFTSTALAEGLNKKRVFIFCPNRAIDDPWRQSLTTTKLFRTPQKAWFSSDGVAPKGDERFFVIHYEYLEKAFELLKIRPDDDTMVILDESHNMNEIVSQRTQLFVRFCHQARCQDVLSMSGTPIKALGAEIVPLLRVIDNFFTDDAEDRFKKIFGRNATKGLDIIKHRLGLVSFKVQKSELKLEKPIFHEHKVVIPEGKRFTLSAVKAEMQAFVLERQKYYTLHRKAYQQTFDDAVATHRRTLRNRVETGELDRYLDTVKRLSKSNRPEELRDDVVYCTRYERETLIPSLPQKDRPAFKDARSVIKYVQLKIQGEALGRILGRKRIECHVAMVPHMDLQDIIDSSTKKTILFTSYVEVIEAFLKDLPGKGLYPLSVYGKNTHELTKTLQIYRQNDEANPLLATFQSLSTAVPITEADRVVMFNSPFRAHDYEQAISRVHRLDATTQTEVWNVTLDTGNEPNLSTRNLDILAWSTQQVQLITGVKSPFDIATTGVESMSEPPTILTTLAHVNQQLIPWGLEAHDPTPIPRPEPPSAPPAMTVFDGW